MRLVLDTNVVLAALFWSGPPHLLIEQARLRNAIDLVTSTALMNEILALRRGQRTIGSRTLSSRRARSSANPLDDARFVTAKLQR